MGKSLVPWWIASKLIAAVWAVSFTSFAILLADDWPNWRGPQRNGNSSETNWLDVWVDSDPKVLWKAQVGTGFSAVAVSQGRLFTMGNSADVDTLWCLDAMTGKVKWRHDHPADLDDRFFEGGPTSTPTVDGDRVYALSRQGMLRCLSIVDGADQWSKNIAQETGASIPGWGFSGSPLIYGQSLILNVGSAGTGVDKSDGTLLWKSGPGEAGYMTPFPAEIGGQQFVLIASGKAYTAIDPESGRARWQFRWLTTYGCNAADPLVSSGKILLSSGYNRGSSLLKVEDNTPQLIWSTKEFQNQLSSSVLLDGYVYGIDGNDTGERRLKCIEFLTGKILWSVDGFGSASLMSAAGRLILLSDSGELIIAPASPKGLVISGRKQVLDDKCWTVPVLAGGLIYCRSVTGDLVCLDVRAKAVENR